MQLNKGKNKHIIRKLQGETTRNPCNKEKIMTAVSLWKSWNPHAL